MLLGEFGYGEGWRSGATSYIRAENTFGELPILMGMTEFWGASQCHIFEWEKTHFGKCSLKFLQQPFSLMAERMQEVA